MIHAKSTVLLTLVLCLLIYQYPTFARVLKKCEAANELRSSKVVDKSFVAHLVCVMQYESKFDTSLVKGPGAKASYSYGVFQISSDKWCSRYRVGGVCNKKCDDFANDNIQDDIVCANLIFKTEGLKHWPGWVKNCKNGKLPNLDDCRNKTNSYGDNNGNDNGDDDDVSDDDSEDETFGDLDEENEDDDESANDSSDDQDMIAVEDVVKMLHLRSGMDQLVYRKLNARKLENLKQLKDIRNPAML